MAGSRTESGEAQREGLLAYIRTYYRQHKYMPQVLEMVEATGMGRASVAWHLTKLRESRKVDFEDGMMARTLRLR